MIEKVVCMNCQSINMNNAKYCSRCGYELPVRIFEDPKINHNKNDLNTNHSFTELNNRQFKILILTISILLYFISLTQVAFYKKSPHYYLVQDVPAIFIFLFGWINALLVGGASLIWFANPILWFSWLSINKPKKSFQASMVSTIFFLSFLLFDKIRYYQDLALFSEPNDPPPENYNCTVTGYGLGFYLWIASSLILVIGNYMRMQSIKTKT